MVHFLLLLLLCGCSPLSSPSEAQNLSAATVIEISPFVPKKPVKIALVLGGGGSKGLAHLGAIRELEAAGIRPDLIVGCSAGAIVGALYADDPDVHEIDKVLVSLKRSDLLDTSYFASRFGFVKGHALEKFMKKHLRSQTFEELKIPLIVVATDLMTGDVVEIHQNEIPIAVRASCAFPGIFHPVLLQHRYLIDGGAACPMPVEIAKKHGADIVIAIDVGEKLSTVKPWHLFGIAKRSIEIGYRHFVAQSLSKADIVITMDFPETGTFSDHLNQEMYDHGRKKTQGMLSIIKNLLTKQKIER